MKRTGKLLACILLVVFTATVAFAAAGNAKKGKYLYKKNCKVCHGEGTEGKKLTPLSKTQSQWGRFFDKDQHKVKPEVWKQFSEQDLNDMRQFLIDHAADSDQPETCG
jgi:cytochrome c5